MRRLQKKIAWLIKKHRLNDVGTSGLAITPKYRRLVEEVYTPFGGFAGFQNLPTSFRLARWRGAQWHPMFLTYLIVAMLHSQFACGHRLGISRAVEEAAKILKAVGGERKLWDHWKATSNSAPLVYGLLASRDVTHAIPSPPPMKKKQDREELPVSYYDTIKSWPDDRLAKIMPVWPFSAKRDAMLISELISRGKYTATVLLKDFKNPPSIWSAFRVIEQDSVPIAPPLVSGRQ